MPNRLGVSGGASIAAVMMMMMRFRNLFLLYRYFIDYFIVFIHTVQRTVYSTATVQYMYIVQ